MLPCFRIFIGGAPRCRGAIRHSSGALSTIHPDTSGNHTPEELAAYRDLRCRASEATIREALTGNYRPEHVSRFDKHSSCTASIRPTSPNVMRRSRPSYGALTKPHGMPAPLHSLRHVKKSRNEVAFDALPVRRRAEPNPRLRSVYSSAACGRRHHQMADCQTLHVVIEPRPE